MLHRDATVLDAPRVEQVEDGVESRLFNRHSLTRPHQQCQQQVQADLETTGDNHIVDAIGCIDAFFGEAHPEVFDQGLIALRMAIVEEVRLGVPEHLPRNLLDAFEGEESDVRDATREANPLFLAAPLLAVGRHIEVAVIRDER